MAKIWMARMAYFKDWGRLRPITNKALASKLNLHRPPSLGIGISHHIYKLNVHILTKGNFL